MSQHRVCTSVCLAFVITAWTAAAADQVRRQSSPGPQTVPVNVSLKTGAATYSSNAPGTCSHAPTASIYGVLSEMWTVSQNAEGRSAQLTLWRSQKDAAETFSLSLNDKKSLTISTVRGGQISGSGTVKLEPSGKGGTFTIDAKTASGETVTGTIGCPAFTPATAEGG